MDWPLQDAKNRFSEVVQRARRQGPQTVTLRGERAAIVLSASDYDALTANRPSLVDDLLAGPAWDDELEPTATGPSRRAAISISRCISSTPTWCPRPAAGAARPWPGCARSTPAPSISAR